MMGGVTTVALTSASVTLATSQALVNIIRLTGTLTATVTIQMPGIYKSWTIDNQIVNSPSSFGVVLASTGATSIGVPPGTQDVFYDGSTIYFKNLGRVGEYWDYAGATVPTWVTLCSKPPYLNCNASTFSSATYPVLANLLGTTTLPDSRGSFRATLNQTTGRLTSSQGGVDGNTIFASSGLQTTTLGTLNLPPYTPSGSVASAVTNFANLWCVTNGSAQYSGGSQQPAPSGQSTPTIASNFTGTAQGGTSQPFSNVPPTYIGGITMIRAA